LNKKEGKKIVWYLALSILALICGIVAYETISLHFPNNVMIFSVIPFDITTFVFGLVCIFGTVIIYLQVKRNRRIKKYKNKIDKKRKL